MRKLKIVFWVLLGLFAVLQLVPAGRTNPPVTGDLDAPPEVKAALVRCCYDCHSNQTRWPWYAYVNPVAFLIVRDTNVGRRKLNFSEWQSYSDNKRSSKSGEALEEIEKGDMPLGPYLWIHRDAQPTPQELQAIKKWSDGL
ncbi:MAG: heme-binding domain-containing protein [Planctomycetes bacterium]|nr:heme-binding domain-containing protein [Planctomycetota bacterium]